MKILDISGKEKGVAILPEQFKEAVRPDLIQRAVEYIQGNNRQPYGAKPTAGTRSSAETSKRRRDFKASYGMGTSRVPRKVISRQGTRMNWVGAFMPGTVGGRRAHPPKSAKVWTKDLNEKERRLAIRSALAASLQKAYVLSRGHQMPEAYPFAISNEFESLKKTQDVEKALESCGLTAELSRASVRKIRAGKGKGRGRKYKLRKGPLLVVGNDCQLLKAARNLPGVDIVQIKNINCQLLAPGTKAGRLTLYTENALKELKEKKLFI